MAGEAFPPPPPPSRLLPALKPAAHASSPPPAFSQSAAATTPSPPARPRAEPSDKRPLVFPTDGGTASGVLAKPAGKFSGLLLSEIVCLELCAGSARLTATLRAAGLDAVGFDNSQNRHNCLVQVTQLDLSTQDAKEVIEGILRVSPVAFVHLAPPCGTASRARDKPIARHVRAAGAPSPKPPQKFGAPQRLSNTFRE